MKDRRHLCGWLSGAACNKTRACTNLKGDHASYRFSLWSYQHDVCLIKFLYANYITLLSIASPLRDCCSNSMGACCRLFFSKSDLGYSAPTSQLTMCRGGNTSLPRMLTAFRKKKASEFPLRFSSDFFANADLPKLKIAAMEIKGRSVLGGALTSTCSISVSADTLRWIFTGSAALLMLMRNTAIRKSFLVPLMVLQAPRDVITWIRGEYGVWAAFLALLVRLFYYIPGELELPLTLVLLVITAPYQAIDLRGTTGAMAACACVAAFLAYQHFSGAGGLRGSLKEGTFLASIAVICLVGVPIAFLFGGF